MVRLMKRSVLLTFGTFLLLLLISNLLLFHIPASRKQQYLLATENVVSALNAIGNAAESVLPNQSTVILEPSPGNCQGNGRGLLMLLMVISAPENIKRRELIREVFNENQGKWEEGFWEKRKEEEKEGKGNGTRKVFQVLFFLGQSAENGMSDEVRGEWERYGDVVVDDLHESYLNLTVKTLRMLKWVLNSCAEASYLVKMDDDVFLNIPKLFNFLQSQQEGGSTPSKLVAGHIYHEVNVDRDPRSKWFTPESVYKPSKFPPFVAGFCYVLGMGAVKEVFEESQTLPSLFHLEDVFLTGLVASKRLHYELKQLGDILTMMVWYHHLKTEGWAMEHVVIHEVTQDEFKCWMRLTTQEDRGGVVGWVRAYWPVFLSCF